MSNVDRSQVVGADIDTTTNDFQFTGYGDIAMVAGVALVQQRLYHALITNPGDVLGYPSYGAGLAGYLEMPLGNDQLQAVQNAATAQLLNDPAVQAVVSLQASQPTPGQLTIDAAVQLVNTLQILPVSVVLTGGATGT